MNTIVLDAEDAADGLLMLLRQLQGGNLRCVLIYGREKLAEITPFPLDTEIDPGMEPYQPGSRMITSEEVRAMLRDFP